MKAQRRHELKTNTLALLIRRLPDLWALHGSKLLLLLVLIALGVVVTRYWLRSRQDAQVAVNNAMATALTAINELRVVDLTSEGPRGAAERRRAAARDAHEAIERVLETGRDPAVLADALVARGDLNWQLASLAPLPGAATQESLRLEQEPVAYLRAADESYRQVIERFPGQTTSVIRARFGLAAIAENRGEWAAARQQYQRIVEDSTGGRAFRDLAQARINELQRLQQRVYLGTTTRAATTTAATIKAATGPTTR